MSNKQGPRIAGMRMSANFASRRPLGRSKSDTQKEAAK
jgi:hypothetical protein